MGQLSFYSADAHPRARSDLEGVLCTRGQVAIFGRGTTARLSIVLGAPRVDDDEDDDENPDPDAPVDDDPSGSRDVERQRSHSADTPDDDPDDDLAFLDLDPDELAARAAGPPAEPPPPTRPSPPRDPVAEWRAHALCCAFRGRGVDADVGRLEDGRPVVRSAFRADLVPLARSWVRGAVKGVPETLELDGPRLRLWVLAAGRQAGPAYLLGLDAHAPGTHEPLLTASRRAGLGATLSGGQADPVLRIVGRRRQARLAELVGARPTALIDGIWPE